MRENNGNAGGGAAKGGASTSGGAGGGNVVAKPKAYRPPGASSRGISATIDFEKDTTTESVGRIISLAKAKNAKRLPVGADPVVESKSAAKNRKRRAKKNVATAQDDGDGGAAEQQDDPNDGSDNHSAAEAGAAEAVAAVDPAQERAKKMRNLQKKLRQIQQLKEKAAGDLSAEQQEKLNSESRILEEIKTLEI